MGLTYKFTIQGRLPSLNDYTNACRANMYKGAKFKDNVENNIILQIRQCFKNNLIIDKPVVIHFTWVEENRKRDLDNIASAKKFILDALVKMKVFLNDSQKYIKGFTDQFLEPEKGKGRVEVIISEID